MQVRHPGDVFAVAASVAGAGDVCTSGHCEVQTDPSHHWSQVIRNGPWIMRLTRGLMGGQRVVHESVYMIRCA